MFLPNTEFRPGEAFLFLVVDDLASHGCHRIGRSIVINHAEARNKINSLEVTGYIKSIWCDVNTNPSSYSAIPLSSDDLEEIDRFLDAWCEENGVDKNDGRAQEVASALIDWYSTSPSYRQKSKLEHAPHLPASDRISALLDQLE